MHIVNEYEFECRLQITTGSFLYQPLKPCRVVCGQILKLIIYQTSNKFKNNQTLCT